MKKRFSAKTIANRFSSWLALGLFAAGSSNANAQQAPFPPRGTEQIPISVRKPADFYSSQSRDEQYAQISQEVEILERQQSLLRRVVKLVSPTVVHIEAVKEEQAPRRVLQVGVAETNRRSGFRFRCTNFPKYRDLDEPSRCSRCAAPQHSH